MVRVVRILLVCCAGLLTLCERAERNPLAPGPSAQAELEQGPTGSGQASQVRGPAESGQAAPGAQQAGAAELEEEQGWAYHQIFDITKPYQPPTLQFVAATGIGYEIDKLRNDLTVWWSPLDREEWRLEGTMTEECQRCTELWTTWEVSKPFSWKGKSRNKHQWFDYRNKRVWSVETERGPKEARWIIDRVQP